MSRPVSLISAVYIRLTLNIRVGYPRYIGNDTGASQLSYVPCAGKS